MAPFRIVVDGGPNIGKTSLMEACRKLGFPVVPEQATAVIQDGLLPWEDPDGFRQEVLERQVGYEYSVWSQGHDVVFHDRGTLAGPVYSFVTGRRLPKALRNPALMEKRYDVMFLLDPVKWVDDGIRYEDPSFTLKVNPVMAQAYEETGVPCFRVPDLGSVDERVRWMFAQLRNLGVQLPSDRA